MLNSDIGISLKMVIATFIFSALIIPVMKKVAHHIGAIDIPRNNEGNRHIHKKPIPKLGGVGIFLAFLFGYMLFGQHSIKMNAILIGSFIIILTGMIDDISEEKMPIILDEAFAYYDDYRLENILNFLIERAKTNQIIIFTCTKREIQMLHKLKVNYNLVEL